MSHLSNKTDNDFHAWSNFESSVGPNEDERRRGDHHEAEIEQLAEMRLWLDRLEKQVS